MTTGSAKKVTTLSSSKLALAARDVRSRKGDPAILLSEPLAIVGLACRFPGSASTPSEFWKLIVEGKDAIREVPPDRWDARALHDPEPSTPGKMTFREGGFIDGVDLFDAAFFGISPREAAGMDPQQRILLETVWEALEDGGFVPSRIGGSAAGVFIAAYNSDYARMQYGDGGIIDAYTTSGTAHSIASGRISYLFDFRGPSVTIDTACSASLVALHLACQSLRDGESDLAVAGGVSLVLGPETGISLSKWGMMAPDGRSKAFDVRANGFGRGEGCGIVLLKRLADALRDGDRVRAILRGSALNQDGRSSTLTAPNGLSQQAVVAAALENARVAPEDVTYIEAHGTGTALGDPIEFESLAAVLGPPAAGTVPCALGSVKANIGHLEAAAGIAGVIKTVLALENKVLPPLVHFTSPNPHIRFEGTRLFVPTERMAWKPPGRPRFAGISSFGFSGTNAHIVLEEAPQLPDAGAGAQTAGAKLLLLSAPVEQGVKALAVRYSRWFSGEEGGALPPLAAAAATTALHRTHHDFRLAVVGDSAGQVASRLGDWGAGGSPWVSTGSVPRGGERKIAFVFSGQGPQWWAMGRELFGAEPVFREAVERIARAVGRWTDWRLLDELLADEGRSRLSETQVAQPAIFALQAGLAALWQSWGVTAAGVVGHSVGEIAAAYVGGALGLEDAARVIVLRGRTMQKATGLGRMCSFDVAPGDLGDALRGLEARVAVAAHNAPRSTVLAGETAAVEEAARRAEASGAKCRWLPVQYAFHSPQMAPLAAEFERELPSFGTNPLRARMVSTVTAGDVDGTGLSAAYWAENIRRPVRFAGAIERLVADGFDTFVEISAHPVLSASILECAGDRAGSVRVVPSLRRGQPERAGLLASLGALWSHGANIDWGAVYPDAGAPVTLPPYPWRRQRYWIGAGQAAASLRRAGRPAGERPLVGARVPSPLRPVQFEALWCEESLPFVSDHRIHGTAVVPATAYLEAALGAGREALGEGAYAVEALDLERVLPLPAGDRRVVQQVVFAAEDGSASWELYSRPESGETDWVRHGGARIVRDAKGWDDGGSATGAPSPMSEEGGTDGATLYADMARAGVEFGGRFRGVATVRAASGEAHATVRPPDSVSREAAGFVLHPAVLDACLQPLGWMCRTDGGDSGAASLYLPVRIDRARTRPTAAESLRVHCVIRGSRDAGPEVTADVRAFEETGRLVVELDGIRLRRTERAALARAIAGDADEVVQEAVWKEIPAAREEAPRGTWVVLAGEDPIAARVAARMEELGHVVRIVPGAAARATASGDGGTGDEAARNIDDVLDMLPGGLAALRGAVSLRALDAGPGPDDDGDAVAGIEARVFAEAVGLAAALGRRDTADGFRLVFVTRGVHAVGAEKPPVAVGQSPVWGVGSTLSLEYPRLGVRMVDLEAGAGDDVAADLAGEIAGDDFEPRVALRGKRRFGLRIARNRAAGAGASKAGADVPVRLEIASRGVLDDLRFVPAEARRPGPGEVQVDVEATGLNFRDVLNALGAYPGDPGPLGDECSGIVSAVGEGVSRLRRGDPVMGFVPAAFARYVTAPADLFVRRPARLSAVEAAATPIAFLTAEYSLVRVAGLAAGEKVLVHAGAGGVGLAAIRIAMRAGAEVFATAGSPEKRAFLKALGVPHVMDSRSLAFSREILEATNGRGVDVVLNSLAGEFIGASFRALRNGGRFVEIGRTGIWSGQDVAALGRDIRYDVVFLGEVRDKHPEVVRGMLEGIAGAIADGGLEPLPVRVFEREKVTDAFRYMAQAKHIGKIAVSLRDAGEARAAAGDAVRGDASYLVTGGLGALGLQAARLLVERGARHLVLAGRSAPGEAAAAAIADLERRGARVVVHRADVGDERDCAGLLRRIRKSGPALRGVIHAAGVVDDAMADRQDVDRFLRVFRPKAVGALNLHRLLAAEPLDFFVMYSSIAALIGSAGQANYAAANAFLDALARARRSAGLPATSVNWGSWAEGGMAASLGEKEKRRMEERGLRPLSSEEGREALGTILDERGTQAVAAGWIRGRLGAADPGLHLLLSGTAPARHPGGGEAPAGESGGLQETLRDAPASRRRTLLVRNLRDLVARVFGLDTSEVDVGRPLREIGLDSLLAVELRNAVARAASKTLPATLLFDYPTVDALADHLLDSVFGMRADGDGERPAGGGDGGGGQPGAELEGMTEEEAEALLLKELEGPGKGPGRG